MTWHLFDLILTSNQRGECNIDNVIWRLNYVGCHIGFFDILHNFEVTHLDLSYTGSPFGIFLQIFTDNNNLYILKIKQKQQLLVCRIRSMLQIVVLFSTFPFRSIFYSYFVTTSFSSLSMPLLIYNAVSLNWIINWHR